MIDVMIGMVFGVIIMLGYFYWQYYKALRPKIARLATDLDNATQALGDIKAEVEEAEKLLSVALDCSQDWGLIELASKANNDLIQANQMWSHWRDMMCCNEDEPTEDRIRWLSSRAALMSACLNALGLPDEKADQVPERIVLAMQTVMHNKATIEEMQAAVRAMRKWLGARETETLKDAVTRTILEAEVQPGAAHTLHKIKTQLGLDPGMDVVKELTTPLDVVVDIRTRKGQIMGCTLQPISHPWVKLGKLIYNTEEV